MEKLKEIRGVGEATARKLHDAGLTDVDHVADAAVELLIELTGFYAARAEAIRRAAEALRTSPAVEPELTIEVSPAPTEVHGDSAESSSKKKAKKTAKSKSGKKAKKLRKKVKALKKALAKAKKSGKKKKARKLKKRVAKAKRAAKSATR